MTGREGKHAGIHFRPCRHAEYGHPLADCLENVQSRAVTANKYQQVHSLFEQGPCSSFRVLRGRRRTWRIHAGWHDTAILEHPPAHGLVTGNKGEGCFHVTGKHSRSVRCHRCRAPPPCLLHHTIGSSQAHAATHASNGIYQKPETPHHPMRSIRSCSRLWARASRCRILLILLRSSIGMGWSLSRYVYSRLST